MISEIIKEEFPKNKVVVIGDLVADQFLRGTIDRVSREAPVFIMKHDETETIPGGAANAAVNVATLGGNAVAIGVVGNDQNGKNLLAGMKRSGVDCGYVVAADRYKTTTKVRVLAGQHFAQQKQVIRIDYENKKQIDPEIIAALRKNAVEAAHQAAAIIISDYGYGVANPAIVEECAKIAVERKIKLLIDSRARMREYKNASTATPNQEEIEQILGVDFSEADCVKLREELGLEALLVTRGNKGMLLIEEDGAPLAIDAIGSKQPVDVTGAGDTVIAAYALGLASGLSFAESARVANHAGGIVVMKQGTANVSPEELVKTIENEDAFKMKAN